MVKKEIEVCDICQVDIAHYLCDVCSKHVCKKHSKLWQVSLGKGIMTKITLCSTCLDKIQYSGGMENNEEFKKIILEFIKKQMIINGLKNERDP